MKINKEVERLIFDAAATANSVGIEAFVIDEDGIRGTDEGKMVVMLKPSFDLTVPFEGFAVGDVKQFVQRYNIHQNNDPQSIDLVLGNDGNTVSMTFKSNKLNIDYRCLPPKRVKSPKKLNDTIECSFEMTEESMEMLKKGAVTMKADQVLFVKDEDSDFVYFEMRDVNKSIFKFELDGKFETDLDRCMFAHQYPVKILMAALNGSDDNFIDIGEQASLTVQKNGISIIIPPRV